MLQEPGCNCMPSLMVRHSLALFLADHLSAPEEESQLPADAVLHAQIEAHDRKLLMHARPQDDLLQDVRQLVSGSVTICNTDTKV